MAQGLTGLSDQEGILTPAPIMVDLTAGEDISANDCVFIALEISELTAGRAYKTDADSIGKSTMAWIVGFAVDSATTGNSFRASVSGVVGGFSSLTPGAPQYVSSTPGALTETAPANRVLVGVAISSTEVLINSQGSRGTVHSGSNKAFISCGYGTNDQNVTDTEKITFSSDSTGSCTSANLNTVRRSHCGLSDISGSGYVLGGRSSADTANTEKTNFANETFASQTSANLSQARQASFSLSQGSSHGYTLGGHSGNYVSLADKTTYSSDSTAQKTTANLSTDRQSGGGNGSCSKENEKGFLVGGDDGSYASDVDKVTYSNDTTSAHSSLSVSSRTNTVGLSDGSLKGYIMGGYSGQYMKETIGLTYSTETEAVIDSAELSKNKSSGANANEGSTKSFMLGGVTSGNVEITEAEKLTYSSEITVLQTSASLTTARRNAPGISDLAV